MRVLVCGGRDYNNEKKVFEILSKINKDTPIDCIITGGSTGADMSGTFWGRKFCNHVEVYYAEWDKYGRAAGPIRNQKMLEESKPDMVVAFPGGRGTADMIYRAGLAKVKIMIVGEE